jgi:hypothetical protein
MKPGHRKWCSRKKKRQYRSKRTFLVEAKTSIYALWAKKINEMKKAKPRSSGPIWPAGSHASHHSIVAREKEKIDAANNISRA